MAGPVTRAFVVAALFVAGLVPGCIVHKPEDVVDHCGPTYTGLSWTQPDLAGQVGNSTPGASWDAGKGALPWTNAWPGLAGMRLAEVRLRVDRPVEHRIGASTYQDPNLSWMHLQGDGTAQATAEGNLSDEVVLRAFHRLADNVSAAPPDDVAAAAQAFLASRHDTGTRTAIPLDKHYRRYVEVYIWSYNAAVPTPLRLDDLLQDLPAPMPQTPGLGIATSRVGDWMFEFTLPTWSVAHGDGNLTLDQSGHARFTGTPTGNASAMRQQAWDLAAAAGLSHLAIEDAFVSAYVC